MTARLPGTATAQDYASLLLRLMPPGTAFAMTGRCEDVLLTAAQELARFHNRILRLLYQSDPLTADEMIANWEEVLGIVPPAGASGRSRRQAASARYRASGGCCPTYFRRLMAAAEVTDGVITEWLTPWTCLSACTYPLYTSAWAFHWQASSVTANAAQQAAIEELFDKIKPSHTTVSYHWGP